MTNELIVTKRLFGRLTIRVKRHGSKNDRRTQDSGPTELWGFGVKTPERTGHSKSKTKETEGRHQETVDLIHPSIGGMGVSA